MTRMKLKTVGQLARQTGVTVRTLHHYDAIGLLVPATRSDGGRRLYDRDDMLRLQQIMVYLTLGLSLDEITRILDDPGFDRRAALLSQRQAVLAQIEKSRALVRGIDEALAAIEAPEHEDIDMSALFAGFDPTMFEDEAKARWGKTDSWDEQARRTNRYSEEDWKRYHKEHAVICARLAELAASGTAPDAPEAQDAARAYAALIDRWFYPCDPSQLSRLADIYDADERFQDTFNGFGAGTADFVIRAFGASAGSSQ